jgi:predicted metal-dependent hydrolase
MSVEHGEYLFGNTLLRYEIERAKRRTVSVCVDAGQGVVVKAPADMSPDAIRDIMARKAAWVVQRLAEYRELDSAVPPREFVGGESHWFNGRQYRLRIDEAPGARRASVELDGAFLCAHLPAKVPLDARAEAVRAALEGWYREQASGRIEERVRLYAPRLGVPAPRVRIRDQEKRWGSCAASDGEIRFNWRLVMAPLPLVDYVVAHELCHLKQADHSAEFWNLLGTVLPDHEERRERLRVEGTRYRL